MKNAALFFCLLFLKDLGAQPYVQGKTRHRFAQLNLGLDARTFIPNGSRSFSIEAAGNIEGFTLTPLTEARLMVGGTHFWGHADLYIAVPVISFGGSGFSTGPETGLKIFPWRIEHRKLRPYLGAAWLISGFQQDQGVMQWRSRFPLSAGLAYNYKSHLLELGGSYAYDNKLTYYIAPATKVCVRTQPFWISLSYKFMLETTLGAETGWLNGSTKKITDSLGRSGKLNGLTLAIGPSSAGFLKPSPYNAAVAPYLGNHQFANVFPEFGLGYYFHRPDLQLNLAYRTISSQLSAYGHTQLARRKALTLEAFLFFADYHGFVPFIGPSLGKEWLSVNETNALGETQNRNFSGLKPGLTFGWDIRPNRLQFFYLRTTLRWVPNLEVQMNNGKSVNFDQLEFNFIQLVVLPGRLF
jgi:hypothetical protein